MTKTEEVTKARVAHTLVKHFGRCEENVGAFPLESGAGEDYFVMVDHRPAFKTREPFCAVVTVGVLPDHFAVTALRRASQEFTDQSGTVLAPPVTVLGGRRSARRWPEKSADQDLAAAGRKQRAIQPPCLRIDFSKLVFQKLVTRIDSEDLDPAALNRIAADVRSEPGKRGKVEGKRLAAACPGADQRSERALIVEAAEDP